MRPIIALEQMGLLKDRLSTPQYQQYMQHYMEDVYRKQSGVVIRDKNDKPSGYAFCNREARRLDMAEAYFISADMVQVARWAAAGLSVDDKFRHDLWPTDYGFLWLEDSLVGTEVWGRSTTTKALSWGRANELGPGTMIVLYTDMEDPRDEVNQNIKEHADPKDWDFYMRMGTLHVHHVMWIADHTEAGPERLPVPEDYGKWAEGEQEPAETATNDRRFILAVLMLMNQTVTSVTHEEADKQATKRFRRRGLPSKVTIVTLRRSSGNRREGETHVEWAHRWIVRGHWAWRHCGADHPYAEEYEKGWRTRVYVAPYVKGPEDKSLVQSTKVYSLTR